jgi:hypothetical protein
MTRSLVAVLRGNFHSAWNFNPAGIFAAGHLMAQVGLGLLGAFDLQNSGITRLLIHRSSQATLVALLVVWVIRIL